MLHLETQDISGTTPYKISDFIAKVARAPSRALLLDYDGTLATILRRSSARSSLSCDPGSARSDPETHEYSSGSSNGASRS